MSRRDDTVRLRHMLDHAREAVALLGARTRQDLPADRLLQLGLTRLIESIGEAAARVSGAGQARWADIPWRAIVGMRNRLIHGYDGVDLNVLWDTVTDDLPPLMPDWKRHSAKEIHDRAAAGAAHRHQQLRRRGLRHPGAGGACAGPRTRSAVGCPSAGGRTRKAALCCGPGPGWSAARCREAPLRCRPSVRRLFRTRRRPWGSAGWTRAPRRPRSSWSPGSRSG